MAKRSRDAVDTIKGFYYQFDCFILQLIGLENISDSVVIEGIEDVDVVCEDGTLAIQCKYYENSEYKHSVIAKPIRLMFKDYANRGKEKNTISYKLYGRYQSGQEKYPGTLSVNFAKNTLFTYSENGTRHVLHDELNMSDEDIKDFLDRLTVDVYAEEYFEQQKNVINKLTEIFQCDWLNAEYYYNNALRFVKDKAIQQNLLDRTVSKESFLREINNKNKLFDKWYFDLKETTEYCKQIKTKYFSHLNVSCCERFFLIDCDELIDDDRILTMICKISRNWSKISKREKNPFCPYIYINRIEEKRLVSIKRKLQMQNTRLWDGYDFLGSDFSVDSILRNTNYIHNVKVKIINNDEILNEILERVSGTKEVYQFFLQEPFYKNDKVNCTQIQIKKTEDISSMI